jgi:hypothetical protein
LIDKASRNAEYIFDVLGIFSALLSSSARQDGATWPMYTLPDFEHFGNGARQLSGALLLAFTPLVHEEYRDKWETYSVKEAEDWIMAGYEVLGTDYYNPEEDRPPRNITSFVYAKTTRSFVPEPRGAGATVSPCWQLSPAPRDTSIINFNLFNEPTFKRLVEFVIYTRQAAISEVVDTELLFGTSAPQKGLDPQSILVLPVFEETGNVDSTIIGHVIAVIPWGLFFQNVLQAGHDGIHAVLRESCGERKDFTYKIDGGNATFLGLGDYHDPAYNGMVRTARFAAYEGDLTRVSGGDLNSDDHCEYTLDVYPSEVFEAAYETNRPIVFTVGVLLVFAFTSAVFVLYDVLVGRRQKAVNRVAVKSNAIVASLFPSQVRDKLYQAADAAEKKNNHGASNNPFKRANNTALLNMAGANNGGGGDNGNGGGSSGPAGMMRGGGGGMGGMMFSHVDDEDIANPYDSSPIADLFPSATVLFMDIAGFTSWSSTREPCQYVKKLRFLWWSWVTPLMGHTVSCCFLQRTHFLSGILFIGCLSS